MSGPLGDASGSFSLFMKYVNGNSAVVSSCLSSWVGFRGKRSYRHVPVEWGVRRPPFIPVYVLCGEFRVLGANVFKVM